MFCTQVSFASTATAETATTIAFNLFRAFRGHCIIRTAGLQLLLTHVQNVGHSQIPLFNVLFVRHCRRFLSSLYKLPPLFSSHAYPHVIRPSKMIWCIQRSNEEVENILVVHGALKAYTANSMGLSLSPQAIGRFT